MIDFSELTPNKVNNGGTTPQGRVSAEEWNALVQQVIDNVSEMAGLMSATPSGDPMHYAYEAAGAVWNATTQFWELNTLTDITTVQMRNIYNLGFLRLEEGGLAGSASYVRTNLKRVGPPNPTGVIGLLLAYQNTTIEVIWLNNSAGTYEGVIRAVNYTQAFDGCTALKAIYGRLQIEYTATQYLNTFRGCVALTRAMIWRLCQNISFGDSPLFGKESLLHAINNSVATSPIVITLHADVYAWASTDSDVQTALAAKPNVTIASA